MPNHSYCPVGEIRLRASILAGGRPDREYATTHWHEHLISREQCACTQQVIQDAQSKEVVLRLMQSPDCCERSFASGARSGAGGSKNQCGGGGAIIP